MKSSFDHRDITFEKSYKIPYLWTLKTLLHFFFSSFIIIYQSCYSSKSRGPTSLKQNPTKSICKGNCDPPAVVVLNMDMQLKEMVWWLLSLYMKVCEGMVFWRS